jgi:hypothetical protein
MHQRTGQERKGEERRGEEKKDDEKNLEFAEIPRFPISIFPSPLALLLLAIPHPLASATVTVATLILVHPSSFLTFRVRSPIILIVLRAFRLPGASVFPHLHLLWSLIFSLLQLLLDCDLYRATSANNPLTKNVHFFCTLYMRIQRHRYLRSVKMPSMIVVCVVFLREWGACPCPFRVLCGIHGLPGHITVKTTVDSTQITEF